MSFQSVPILLSSNQHLFDHPLHFQLKPCEGRGQPDVQHLQVQLRQDEPRLPVARGTSGKPVSLQAQLPAVERLQVGANLIHTSGENFDTTMFSTCNIIFRR